MIPKVDAQGLLIGITTDPHLPVRHLRLEPGENLLLYTDGITEARDTLNEQFGEERLAIALSTLGQNTAPGTSSTPSPALGTHSPAESPSTTTRQPWS
ncbi:SpoIIE family protein phosphatase [Streptomyces fagopyri]